MRPPVPPRGGALRVLAISNMYPRPEEPDYGTFVADMCDALERQGLALERAVIDTRAHGPLRTPAKYAGLLRRSASLARGCDVIYAHYLFPTGAVAATCGRLARRPWVITAHGRDVRNLGSDTLRRASAPAIGGAAALIAVSRFLAGELRATGLRLPPVYVASMGVDLERFHPADRAAARARLRLRPAAPLILAAGGLTERKNPLGLLQALALVRRELPDARLALVGDGPLAGAVDAGVARLGLDGAVHRTGPLPHADVAEWMAACDALALPSHVEPLGIVALEALASGRPVVATRVGGAAEVVGNAGVTVDPMSPRSIADGLLRVLGDPPPPAACRRAAEAHGLDREAARVAAVLQAAAAPPAPPTGAP
ncbi:MAG TPA: glycosyltransferase [Miltoncostaeaceae bacterium]|nr:glycosyltransferase [Miltoncostaeaceae bacterium]